MSFEMMHSLALKAMSNAYAPYSNFHVGCSIRTENGQYFSGANVENLIYPSSQCAEASALGAMVSQGERKIEEVLIVNQDIFCAPCGNCRQKLAEFIKPSTKIHICDGNQLLKTLHFGELLPYILNKHAKEQY